MAQRTSKPLAGKGFKVRYNSSRNTWQVYTFFIGPHTVFKWVDCRAILAAWYYNAGAENVTAPSTRVPFTEVLHRQRRMKESEFSNVQPIPQSQASF